MKEYVRDYPLFSLCGLNCGLCPRYHTDGSSKCPGCGGRDFHPKHPTCAVITCNQRRDKAEYCFQCSEYPCERYRRGNRNDSFISYRNVSADMESARRDPEQYKAELDKKVEILGFLIDNYNDGRRKSFYCNAVNLLKIKDLKDIIREIEIGVSGQDITLKEKIMEVQALFETKASEAGTDLQLRKF